MLKWIWHKLFHRTPRYTTCRECVIERCNEIMREDS